MSGRVILVTGTPCVGKTSVARLLASEFNALYLNLTELALQEELVLGRDEERDSVIVDENLMSLKIRRIIENHSDMDIIVDGHYAVRVVPEELATQIFVLRRDPVELRKLMKKSGLSGRKLWENLASEILDVCLCEALDFYEEHKVCELDISGKSVEEIVIQIIQVLNGVGECLVGVVDWLSKLEREGLLEDYVRI